MRNFDEFNVDVYDVRLRSGIKIFEKQLKSLEGRDILINGLKSRGIILNHLNDMSTDKDDRGLNVSVDTDIKCGDYIFDMKDNEMYITLSKVDNHYYNKTCTLRQCDNTLSFSFTINPIYCTAVSDSYGVKLTGGTEFTANVDTKVKVTVQRNEETLKIIPDDRFILNNSRFGIYKVGDIEVLKDGRLSFVCSKDKYMEGYDDLVSNIAYQPHRESVEPPVVDTYELIGSDVIKLNNTSIYELTPSVAATFSIDGGSVAEIVETNVNSCTVKCLQSDDVFDIVAKVNEVEVARKTVFTSKR